MIQLWNITNYGTKNGIWTTMEEFVFCDITITNYGTTMGYGLTMEYGYGLLTIIYGYWLLTMVYNYGTTME